MKDSTERVGVQGITNSDTMVEGGSGSEYKGRVGNYWVVAWESLASQMSSICYFLH